MPILLKLALRVITMRKILYGITALGVVLTSSGSEKLIARTDYDIPQDWQIKKILGKEWWPMMNFYRMQDDPKKLKPKTVKRSAAFTRLTQEMGVPVKPEVKAKYKKLGIDIESPRLLPAFTRAGWVGFAADARPSVEKTGSYSIFLPPRKEFDMARDRGLPILLSGEPFMRGRIGKITFVTGEKYTVTAKDMADFQKWRKEHPNFLGFKILSEWDNIMNMMDHFYTKAWWPATVKAKKVREDQKEEYWQKYRKAYPEGKNRREWIEQRVRRYYQRAVDGSFGDPSLVIPLSGSVNINHLAAYWGSKLLLVETSRQNIRWQGQIMFTRGAARQFDVPWGWYVAGYHNGYTKDGVKKGGTSPNEPPGGISVSAMRRAFFMTWFAGSSLMQSEIDLWTPWKLAMNDVPFGLTEAGKAYVELYDFVQKYPDRGVPYTPVALLVNYDRGSNRAGGTAFWRFPYTHADSMLDAFYSCILDWPYDPKIGWPNKKGTEYVFAHNPYGDIFDAITPDFKDQTTFKRVLPGYKAAVLLGEYPENPKLAEILMDFVRKGGTLLINIKHLNKHFPSEFSGLEKTGKTIQSGGFTVEKIRLKNATVQEKDPAGNPILLLSKYGKGKVLVSLQHYMTDFDGKNVVRHRLPLIDKILRQFSAETLPLKVEGDIQYGLNKNKTGWRLYLINNKGIKKFSDTPGIVDPTEKRIVKVTFPKFRAREITELFSAEKLPLSNGGITLELKPGEIKVLEIR